MLLTLLALMVAQDADPLEPARAGKVQCYDPIIAEKTCRAMGAYRFGADGEIWNDAQSVVNDTPHIVLRATTRVYVRDDAECAKSDNLAEEITAIEVDGAALTGAQYDAIRKQAAEAMSATIGNGELCTVYHPKPDGSLRAIASLNGVARPDLESVVRWVNPADWRLRQ